MLTITQVAEWEPNGRASDIFSLGCILLEILTLDQEGSLDRLRANRSTKNTAYHANLDRINDWIPLREDVSPIDYNLIKEIRAMLSRSPNQRPSAQGLLERLEYCDKLSSDTDKAHSIFDSCCRLSLMKKSDHQELLDEVKTQHKTEIKDGWKRVSDLQSQIRDLKQTATNDAVAAVQQLKDMEKKHRREMKKVRQSEGTGVENGITHLRDEVQRLTAELIESKRMLEQADTAFAQAIQRLDTSPAKSAETKSLNDSSLAGDERAANPQNHTGSAKRDSPAPSTDPSSKKREKKSRSATSLDSMIAQPGEHEPAQTASESTGKSDSRPTPFDRRPLTARALSDRDRDVEMRLKAAAEDQFKKEARVQAAKEKKKELRASQGRWPRLGKLFGSKAEDPEEWV
ncbi:hypothetical protein G6514_005334 [Epicoccum nigrum]|nr:hypothetical protein G6514_005334 [Epicoccum nigrum]